MPGLKVSKLDEITHVVHGLTQTLVTVIVRVFKLK